LRYLRVAGLPEEALRALLKVDPDAEPGARKLVQTPKAAVEAKRER
jgi:hypothetical protein